VWQAEIAEPTGVVVWQSKPVTRSNRVTIDAASGTFVAKLAGQDRLDAQSLYFGRVRRLPSDADASSWSPWHQAFRTVAE
jgi:hypothetical protein